MSLFSKKQKTETKPTTPSVGGGKADLSWVLIKPRITEKSTDVSQVRAYVFNVATDANKREIAQAFAQVYKVFPAKVRVTAIQSKAVRNARTGKSGVKSGGKKAYIYLKVGDSINV